MAPRAERAKRRSPSPGQLPLTDRSTLRAGAVAAVAGAVTGLAANALRPIPLGLDTRGVLRQIAATARWEVVHAVLLLALVLLVVGLAVAAASLAREPGGWPARLGLVPLIAGGSVALVATVLDGFARRRIARLWVTASTEEQEVAFRVAEAVDLAWFALFAAWVVLLLGVVPVLLGIAQARSARYPTWLGVTGAAAGAPCLVLGVFLLLAGGRDPVYVALAVLVAVITLWVGLTGVVLWRAGEQEVAANRPSR